MRVLASISFCALSVILFTSCATNTLVQTNANKNANTRKIEDKQNQYETEHQPKGTVILNKDASQAPLKTKQNTSGTFCGDVDVEDDF